MEKYFNFDKTVFKFVHDTGAETAIKTVRTCMPIKNQFTGEEEIQDERNKYVVFVSSSVGCPVKCSHCYLTAKEFPFYKLSRDEIIEQTIRAIQAAVKTSPSLSGKFIKISFMGMGDAHFIANDIPYITDKILTHVIYNKLAIGLDGIDIGTSIPKNNNFGWKDSLLKTIECVSCINRNKLTSDRSIVRMFVSLFSTNNIVRSMIVPCNKNILTNSIELRDICQEIGVDLIFHNVFIKGINDSTDHLSDFLDTYNRFFKDNELRIIRLNVCKNSKVESPSEHQHSILLDILNKKINKLKVQYSAGSTIKASCGQFIMQKFK